MFEQLVGKLPVGIAVVDENFNIVYLNDFFLDRLPHEQRNTFKDTPIVEMFSEQGKFIKRRLKSVFVLQHPSFSYWEQRPHIFPFKSSRPITGEETQMYQNMEIIPVKDKNTGQKLACIFLQDVTAQASYFREQQRLSSALKKEHEAQRKLIRKLDSAQSQLIQAEKMASTGQLAAGIAHEINNPIGFVNANLETLSQYASHLIEICDRINEQVEGVSEDAQEFVKNLYEKNHYDLLKDDMQSLIDESTEGLTRVRDIVENLKLFSLDNNDETKDININDIANQLIKLVSTQYPEPTYKLDTPNEKVEYTGHAGMLKQALMNVIVNAAQAIEAKGFIKITLTDTESAITIKVLDSGAGIPEKNLSRIFEPFFTTARSHGGTGLGMAIVYNLVSQRLKGELELTANQPGFGLRFTCQDLATV